MRLDEKTCDIIKREVASQLGAQAIVRLFGSRTDDTQRGGDIDLLIEPGYALTQRIQIECRLAASLYIKLGGRNRLVHEYIESADDLLNALQQALQGVHILTETQLRFTSYAQKVKLI